MFNLEKTKKGEIVKAVTAVEIQPYQPKTETNLIEYQKIPIAQLGTLGLTFESVMKPLQKVGARDITNNLYRVKLPVGAHLAKVHGENAFIGTAIKEGKGIVGQARLLPVSGSGAVPPINSAMLCMAVVLISVTKKMDSIEEKSQQILAFLEEKEKAKLEGNLEILTDVFNNYKYNLENQLYKTNKHMQVQGIKSEAEQSIKLHRSQIEKELVKQSFLHGDSGVEEKIGQIEKNYKNYQLALYIYTFAYFLEIMLFENFEKGYLESVSNTIERHCEEYGALYQKTRQMIEEYSKKSIQTYAVKALSGISKKTGKLIAKIPIINKTQFDENLIATGENLAQKGEERSNRVMEGIFAGGTEFITPFKENIHTINVLYNETVDILVDNETLYIKGI